MEQDIASNPAGLTSIGAPPEAGQKVEYDGKVFLTIKEGLAHILVPEDAPTSLDPKAAKNGLMESQSVFYNPIQQFNRDLSVLAIKAYGEDLMQLRHSQLAARKSRKPRNMKRKAAEADLDMVDNDKAADAAPTSGITQDNPAGFVKKVDGSKLNGNMAIDPVENVGDQLPQPEPHKEELKETPKENSFNGAGTANLPMSPRNPPFRILDALSATGLRALRYAQEIPFTTSVTANDLSKPAVESIKMNVQHNRLDDKIKPLVGNALSHMYNFVGQSTEQDDRPTGRYDVIDLDPYGTAVPFLDAAMHAIKDGGLLCVTCTDAGVWAGSGYPEKAYSLYGGTPTKGFHSHESGLRLILHAIASSAARHGMSTEPLLSLSIDFYARVFLRVHRNANEVKLLAGRTMLVYSCDGGCGAWQTQFLLRNTRRVGKDGKTQNYKHSLAQGPTTGQFCEHCGYKLHVSGPMYGGPLHHPAFIEAILALSKVADKTTYATTDRIEGMLITALEETMLEDTTAEETNPQQKASMENSRSVPRANMAEIDAHPFYFIPSALAKVLHCQAPAEAPIRGALRHAGYKATRSHAKPGSIRTNAPWSFIWQMMREWVRQKAQIKEGAIKPGTPGWGIMGYNSHHEQNGVKGEQKTSGEAAPDKTVEKSDTNSKGDINHGGSDGDQPSQESGAAAGAGAREANNGGVQLHVSGAVVFDERLGKERQSGGRRLVRYQVNPRENWGPMNKAHKGRVQKSNNNGQEETSMGV